MVYDSLLGKKEQKEKKDSAFDFLLRPYKILFKNSSEEPKEVGIKEAEKSETLNTVEQQKVGKQPKLSSKPRAGKVLWKKK